MKRCEQALREVESHLAAIAASPCMMGSPDIEHLCDARQIIATHLARRRPAVRRTKAPHRKS
jgi:hypothetical protein